MTNADPARQQWRALLQATAQRVEDLDAETIKVLKRRWQQQYAAAQRPAFLWHGFSFRLHPHLVGAHAVAAYERQPVKSFLVFFEQTDWGFRCHARQLPPWAQLRELAAHGPARGRDVYLAQPQLSWVFCQTHEPDFGPYFAQARAVPSVSSGGR
ncbi:hypothetical protein DLM85_03395 [Hymenobacter edaphi]|uniref:DUF4275 domain-containing protein n=2 Tax=Hymenobacter edaphi TaxID=2211146 RepID=A0A328BS89_9BACT|nr:hypothetical protein DLM85_03395 [Hymenobacter edaphi]